MPEPSYPSSSVDRARWIRERRGPRSEGDVWQPHSWFVEIERNADGIVQPTLTLLLRSRECPWRCLMCDLWKFTVNRPIPRGAIAAQVKTALAQAQHHPQWTHVRQIKLYNGGSFFDAAAVPPPDHPAIAQALARFDRVIVECHPALVHPHAARFQHLLQSASPHPPGPQLEVAMGLETVHPLALESLNKRMTLEDFRRAAARLHDHQINLRTFVLVQPPFVPPTEALDWTLRSTHFAFDCHASVVTLIPTRPGNGALDALAQQGHFTPPTLHTLERALASALPQPLGRVFADLWDLERFSVCPVCLPARRRRLEAMNLRQQPIPPLPCPACQPGRQHSPTPRGPHIS
jgi:archaeosine synthase beta-subunit